MSIVRDKAVNDTLVYTIRCTARYTVYAMHEISHMHCVHCTHCAITWPRIQRMSSSA